MRPDMIHPDRYRQQRRPSRRDMLLFALAGLGTCACGGIAGAGAALWLNRDNIRATEEAIIQVKATTQTEGIQDELPLYAGMVTRAAWGGLPPNHLARNEFGFSSEGNPEGWYTYDNLPSAYQTVIVHHSVVYNQDDPTTLLDIQNLHREDRAWADVAYHYFVGQDGRVYEGRSITARGTHVGGFNTGSVGVCLLGDFTQIQPTPAQLTTANALISWLANELALTHIAGHRDFNPFITVCPGDNLAAYIASFGQNAGLQVGTEGYIPPNEREATGEASACACCACNI